MPAYLAIFLLALAACALLHLAAISAAGLACGVGLRKLSVGLGPVLLRSRRFELKLVPFAGHVEFENWRSEEVDAATTDMEGNAIDASRYLDLQPRYRQFMIILSGCAALLLMAFAMLGWEAGRALGHSFAQIIGGALSPLESAQAMLQVAHRLIRELSPAEVLALVAVKLAALNLLPLAPFNGASAIGAAVSGSSAAEFCWKRWNGVGLWLSLGLGLSWLVALAASSLLDGENAGRPCLPVPEKASGPCHRQPRFVRLRGGMARKCFSSISARPERRFFREPIHGRCPYGVRRVPPHAHPDKADAVPDPPPSLSPSPRR